MNEIELLEILNHSRKVVLLEPNYKRKYIPLGLAKIANYVKQHGAEVVFQRNYKPCNEDLVCVTTLFTYESHKVFDAIGHIYSANYFLGKYNPSILVGGVFASLMPNEIQKRFPSVKIFVGYSKVLDMVKPDYSIDWGIEEKWQSFSFAFTSRGCPNHCAYCAVKTLEPDIWINPNWKEIIDTTKPNVMFSDNNLSAQPFSHIENICNYLKENKIHVIFDNGFDCKHITPEFVELVKTVPFLRCGLRLAFDRIEENGVYQEAAKKLLDAKIAKDKLMSYVLFNFNDTPSEANFRMEENNKLGIRPYPQQFTPLNTLNRDVPFVGKYWSKYLLRAFRYFWLMRGLNTKMKFTDYISKPEIIKRFKLEESDLKLMETKKCQPLLQCLPA
jgi:hypothetical protein